MRRRRSRDRPGQRRNVKDVVSMVLAVFLLISCIGALGSIFVRPESSPPEADVPEDGLDVITPTPKPDVPSPEPAPDVDDGDGGDTPRLDVFDW